VPSTSPAARRQPGLLLLRLITAAGLAADAYIHADLAPAYDGIAATVSQGTLFRAEAGAAALAALLVLALGGRVWFALAALVAASALGAILLYRYVDVGSLGPLPNMYEPVWFAEKTAAAVAAAVATLAAAGGLLGETRLRRPSARAGAAHQPVSARPARGGSPSV
jgi:hypothetical protein